VLTAFVVFVVSVDVGCHCSGRLKRLNVIFERAADRRSGGIREDKLLRLLPVGTAIKFGLDPAAFRRRQLEWREQQKALQERESQAEDEDGEGAESQGKKRSKRKKKKRSKRKSAEIRTMPDMRVISRGTFLAMFAYESSIFINALGQNERLDRERRRSKHAQKKGAATSPPKLVSSLASAQQQPTLPKVPSPPGGEDRKVRVHASYHKKRKSKRKSKRRSTSGHTDAKEESSDRASRSRHRSSSGERSRSSSRSSGRSRSNTEGSTDCSNSSADLSPPPLNKRTHTNPNTDQSDPLSPFPALQSQEQHAPPTTSLQQALAAPLPDLKKHPADEAAGGVKPAKVEPKFLSTHAERKEYRRVKKQKHKSRRHEIEHELKLVEERKRALEEEHAKITRYDYGSWDNTKSDDCVFFSNVSNVLRELLPGLSGRAMVGVAPPSDNSGYASQPETMAHGHPSYYHQHPNHHPVQHFQPSSLQAALQNMKSAPPAPQEDTFYSHRDTRGLSFSSHSSVSTEDSVIGDSVLSSPSR